jgi:16S rRNA (uracil1498-N3)-methyltransferase
VEKAVEIGLTDLTFLACKHSEKKVQKMERLEKIAIAAMKQSQGLYLLNMHPMLPFDQFNFGEDEVFIAHCHEGQKTPISAIEGAKNRVFLVGPEGDFSNEEVEIALRKGATALDLGSQRLRTETAGLVCVVHGSSKLEFSL